MYPIFLILYTASLCAVIKDYYAISPNTFPLYFLVFFSATSFYYTLDYMISFGYILKILTGLSMYVLIYNAIKTKEGAKKVLFSIVISSLVPMVIGYYQFITGLGGAGSVGGFTRINGGLGPSNEYGEFLTISTCAALALILLEKKKNIKRFLFIIIASLIVSSILALNRGTWIGLTIGLITATAAYYKMIKIRWIIIVILCICVLFSGIIVKRFKQLEDKTTWGASQNTLKGRIEFWKALLPYALENPLIGQGIGSSKVLTEKYMHKKRVPHNDYLRIFLEVGLPGALLYIVFLFSELIWNLSLISNKRNWYINYPMLILIIYWIILSLVQNMIYNVVVFPMFMAMIAVSRKWNLLNSPQLI